MFKSITAALIVVLLASASVFAIDKEFSQHMQNISVTVRTQFGSGSGVLITRKLKLNKDSDECTTVNFCWTAAHVCDNLRSTRKIVDSDGNQKTVVEFKDAYIVQEIIQDGRSVGEYKMAARIIKYSHAEDGEDLCLLMLRKRNFTDVNAKFYLDEEPLYPGTKLFHVGSLLGAVGSNSVTFGVLSQVGRVLPIGSKGGVVFNQTSVTAMPGSSGGGVYLTQDSKEHKGQCIGLIVRGIGESFNFIVPVSRMQRWCSDNNLMWALDETVEMPTLEEVNSLPIE